MEQTFIWTLGFNHSTAPIHVREQYSISGDRLSWALGAIRPLAREAVIISTCNRLEVHALLERGQSLEDITTRLFGSELAGGLSEYTYSYKADAAVAHLFRVTAGLDSLVLGEVQILGQVQRAWQAAHQEGTAGPVLSQLFHRAIALGKRVHSETSISRRPASVSYAAVVLARQIFGRELAERCALVIGTGEVGEGVARCLHDYGVRATVVAHRQLERAHTLARRYQAASATWDDLPRCLAEADIVISSTAAPHYVLQFQQVENAMRQRSERPLYLIDLAVPRDIEPSVADLPGVHLHNIDDLHAVVQTTLLERQEALFEIEVMAQAETARFVQWLRSRSTAPTIKDLQAQAGEITRQEFERAKLKLPDLTEREQQIIQAMGARIAGKLLHGPIQWLKAQAEGDRVEDEPDYGMSTLTPKELAELFYRSAEHVAGDGIEGGR